MVELAKEYHDNLQNQGCDGRDPGTRDQSIDDILLECIKTEPNNTDSQTMSSLITRDEVMTALKLSDNDTAAGLDGATYKMWKSIAQKQEPHGTEEPCDIIHLMTAVFNDIEQHGTTPESHFADGWMCPIYKNR